MRRLRRRLKRLLVRVKVIRRKIRAEKAKKAKPTGLSKNGAEFIAEFEGFSPIPYSNDGAPGGNCTIGYGTLIHLGPCRKQDFKDWGTITHERGLELLQDECQTAWHVVEEFVTVPLTQNMADALISFSYNCGSGAFMSSTLLRVINAGGSEQQIRHEFSRWVKAGGQTLPGLVRRRKAEADLYFTP